MIKTTYYKTLRNGVVLFRTFSDKNVYIKPENAETPLLVYKNHPATHKVKYVETDIIIPTDDDRTVE